MDNIPERRSSSRLTYVTPLNYKVCSKETIDKLFNGYTLNVSEAGLLCNIKEKVAKDDILWLSFDKGTLSVCTEMDRKSLVYQNGVLALVVRVDDKVPEGYDVGVRFLIREEQYDSHIYPKVHFLKDNSPQQDEEEDENASE
ncbi:MAG: PilZ domain-containing protein [Candidatus Omnitrophica bacterium]|jgi:hypothetical protein|nr:PilZ domain-containing protein [Candidatus Omnitrophota bacterium]